jgi:hypothetical protein
LTSPLEPLPAPQLPLSAVFVDLENMAINPDPDHPAFDLARVMKQVRILSNPIVRMGFADWSKLPQFARTFVLQGFDQIQATYVTGSKNSADMQMCVDALEVVLMRKEIEAVFLVSGDADFTPLARAVRRQGRQVIGIGWRDKASFVFRRNCDRFLAYEELPGLSIDEAAELGVAERKAERRLASQQARRSVPAYRPGARPAAGKPRRQAAQADATDAEGDGFLRDPRDGRTEEAAEPAAEARSDRPERSERRERPKDAAEPADPVARLREPPLGFLGSDQQFAVLEALHGELSAQSKPRRRNQIVAAVAQKLSDVRRQQVAAVERILWHAKAYDVVDRGGQRSSLLWNVQLRAKNRDFDELRRTHDIQLIADAAEAGIFLSAEDWSDQLYGGPEDADVIAEYFREAAGLSPAFAKETGIAPPVAEEDGDGETAEEDARESEAADAGTGEQPEEASGEGEAAAEDAEGAAAEKAPGGEADETAEEVAEQAAEPAGEPEADAEPDDGASEPAEGASEPADGEPAGEGDDRARSQADEPAAGGADSQRPLFGEPEEGEPEGGEADRPEESGAEPSGEAAREARSGWWSRL